MSQEAFEKWLQEAMRQMNALTPDVHGKANDPDWFLLRNHLEDGARVLISAAIAEATKVERERCCQIVFANCGSDNVAQRTVEAIRGRT